MLKFFKVSLDFIELFYNFDMLLPCPVPLQHSGRSNVRRVGIHNELLVI